MAESVADFEFVAESNSVVDSDSDPETDAES